MKPWAICAVVVAVLACGQDNSAQRRFMAAAHIANPDSMGAMPTDVKRIPVDGPRDLKENSTAVITAAQPEIVFTINDAGNEPELFALDTNGVSRGIWRVSGATNVDWEAMSSGPCGSQTQTSSSSSPPTATPRACLYIADTGDNSAIRNFVTLYRVNEPAAMRDDSYGTVSAENLSIRYPDTPHDVEAVYTTRNGDTYLITKRLLRDANGQMRRSLVYLVPAAAWDQKEFFTAQLVDSLPIVPGSSKLREITDASLSDDSRFLAVRTYGQVFVFATDSTSGRVLNTVAPAVCNIQFVERKHGEGISWFAGTRELLIDTEGRKSPMYRISCPLPAH